MALIGKESPLKGIAKKNHKYLSREWKKNKWQYTYKQPTKQKKNGNFSLIKQTVQNILKKFKIGDRVYGGSNVKYSFKELTEKGWKYIYKKGIDIGNNLLGNNENEDSGNDLTRGVSVYRRFLEKQQADKYDTRTKITDHILPVKSETITPLDKNNKPAFIPYIADRLKRLNSRNVIDLGIEIEKMRERGADYDRTIIDHTEVKRSNAYLYTADTLDKLPKTDIASDKSIDVAKCNIHYRDTSVMTEEEIDSMWATQEAFDESTATSMNCYSCALAYDMRRRGYDVAANYDVDGELREVYQLAYEYPIPTENITSQSISYNADYDVRAKEAQDIQKNIEKKYRNEDCRGIVTVTWVMGGGHAMAYEVNDGKMTIIDTQCGEVYDIEFLSNWATDITFTRTDNLELTDNACQFVQFYEPADRGFKTISKTLNN